MSRIILIVDDEENIRLSLKGILEDDGYQVLEAANGADAIEIVREEVPDLMLLDIWMPGMDGIQTLERAKQLFPELTVVMMSGHGTIETAVRATKLGAFDFVEKPFSLEKVLITIANAISIKELRKENHALRLASLAECELVGHSKALESLREQVHKVSQASTPLLVKGESGVGKELLARSIHHYSARRDNPFVGLRCSSMPEELLLGELLGYEKGVAGSDKLRRGKLDLADGGTLFLQDVDSLPNRLQGELVRIIRDNCFERLGGGKHVKVDLRIIAATAADLPSTVHQGNFREDLYQMLNVIPFNIPPLREHLEDIPDLIRHFVDQFYRREGWEPKKFDQESITLLQRYAWPGNARELKNVVERILIMAAGPVVSTKDIPSFILDELDSGSLTPIGDMSKFSAAREQFERDFILKGLEACGWDIDLTASSIGLERTAFHRKLVQYGISLSNAH